MLEGSLVRRRLNSNGALAPVGKGDPKKEEARRSRKHTGVWNRPSPPNVQLWWMHPTDAPEQLMLLADSQASCAEGLRSRPSAFFRRVTEAPHALKLGGAAFWAWGAVGQFASSAPYAHAVVTPALASTDGVPLIPASLVSAPMVGGIGAGASIGDL